MLCLDEYLPDTQKKNPNNHFESFPQCATCRHNMQSVCVWCTVLLAEFNWPFHAPSSLALQWFFQTDRRTNRQRAGGLGRYSKWYYLIGAASSCYAVWVYTVHVVLYRLHNTHRGNVDAEHTDTERHKTHAQTQKNETWNEKKMYKGPSLMYT